MVDVVIPPNKPIQYYRYESGQFEPLDSEIIVEMPVSLTINGDVWLTLMCTPTDQEALAVGFLYNESLIQSIDEIAAIRVCPAGDNVDIWVNHPIEKPEQWRRTSGCTGGITSVESNSPVDVLIPAGNGTTLTPDQVSSLIGKLFEAQSLYRLSGGVHTSALSDGGKIVVAAEDIGRHNTLDKLAGRCLMENIHLDRCIVVTTGRISSEMLQKSRRLGASIVISRTSPSSLSIELAEKWGITLIGYTRRNQFNIYTHPVRVLAARQREEYVEQTPKI